MEVHKNELIEEMLPEKGDHKKMFLCLCCWVHITISEHEWWGNISQHDDDDDLID